jgi:hypothetical protein
MMFRKSIVVTVMLLLAVVQALAVTCDLRCSLMTISTGSQTCGNHVASESSRATKKQCHATATDSGRNPALSDGNCDASICKAQLEALVKKSSGDELLLNHTAISTPAKLICVFDEFSLIRSPLHRSPQQNASAPLDLRPGSSLRI